MRVKTLGLRIGLLLNALLMTLGSEGCRHGRYEAVFEVTPSNIGDATLPTIIYDDPWITNDHYTLYKDARYPNLAYFVPQMLSISPSAQTGRSTAIAWKQNGQYAVTIPFSLSIADYNQAIEILHKDHPNAVLYFLTFRNADVRFLSSSIIDLGLSTSIEVRNPSLFPFDGILTINSRDKQGSKDMWKLLSQNTAILLEYRIYVQSITTTDRTTKERVISLNVQIGNLRPKQKGDANL